MKQKATFERFITWGKHIYSMGKNQFTYIDLFAGCGGMSLGLHNAGWKGLFAIEKDSMAFETLKFNLIDRLKHFNWPSWFPIKNHDIREVIKNYSDKLLKLQGRRSE